MTKTRWIYAGAGVAVLLVVLQLVPSPPAANPDIRTEVTVPSDVMQVLRQSCYDCHSNETVWPWYAYVAPMKWLVRDHVGEARDEMNFSDWGVVSADDRAHLWEEVVEEVEEGHMPLRSYLILHPGARLSDADRETLLNWARSQAGDQAGEGEPGGDQDAAEEDVL